MKTTFKKFRVTYEFTKSKFGFQNSVTVSSISEPLAIEKAKQEIKDCYGSEMFKYFIIKNAITV